MRNNPINEPARLFTVPETAAILRITRAQAYRLIKQDAIPSIRVGHAIRVPESRLTLWIENQIGRRKL